VIEALSIIVFDGRFDRVHYAVAMAAAAAAINRPVTLHFAGPAVHALRPGGWRHLDGAARDADFAARGVAGYEVLVDACRQMKVRRIACEMALRAAGLSAGDLDPGVEVAGVVTLLAAIPPGASLLFV
jgi:peroxiredoxin family protein